MSSNDPPTHREIAELFEHAPCGLLSTDLDGAITQVNQTFLTMIGCTRETLLGKKRFQELLTTTGQIYHDTHFGPLVQMQGFVREVAFELLGADQRRVHVLVNAERHSRPDGAAHLLISVFGAADRRGYEHELLLARRQADKAVEAERAARQLAEQAMRAKDEFLAMVSHELRTPLTAILGWTQIMQQEQDLSADLREGLAVVERNARAQSELINDLLDLSRIIAGKMRLSVEQLHLAELISAALDTARPAAEAKGVRLQSVLDSSIIVAGDPGRLQQVFWNLLTNAVKFTPRDGYVRVVMQRINSHVEIRVIDSGQGMNATILAHAFERFRQSDSRETQKTAGLGLGLSIVKNLVEMHGGTVSATSDGPGLGSTFLIQLPMSAVQSETAHGQSRAAISGAPFEVRGISLQKVRVLVVDDEADAREAVRRVLLSAGAEVFTASSADEALRLLELHQPDVLTSDVGLPGDDGYELIRKVRMLGGSIGRVQAVALTAYSRLEDRTRALLSGYQMHLTKPVDARELIATVATLARK